MSKYKYLNYVPLPVNLDKTRYDLAGDTEFCRIDSRIPLLIVTQYGIFPSRGLYSANVPEKDYSKLEGLENQHSIAFIGRGYLSDRERNGIFELAITPAVKAKIKRKEMHIDLHLFSRIENEKLNDHI
jgi:hypothetical protein